MILTRDGQEQGASTLAVHPLLGAHVRLPEEPERHVWQSDVGTDAQPWLADHQVHGVAALPGAAYCEMALAAARAVLGDACEARDIAFEEMLLLEEETPVSAVASVTPDGSADFVVKTHREGEEVRRATAVLRTVDVADEPTAYDVAALLAAHPVQLEGAEMRDWYDARGIQYGPAFTGLDDSSHHRGAGRIRARRGGAARVDPIPAGRLRRCIPHSGRLLPGSRCAPRSARRHERHADAAVGRARVCVRTPRPATRTTATCG